MDYKCPNCDLTLKPVSVRSHYGKKIVVDQCTNCGGLWFDPKEYYQVATSYIDNLDPINEDVLNITRNKAESKRVLLCPRDGNILVEVEDISIPKQIKIETCKVCEGYWFEKGEYRKVREDKGAPEEFITGVDKLLENYSQRDKYVFITNLSRILMQPYYNNSPDTELNTRNENNKYANTALIVIETILRLLLKY